MRVPRTFTLVALTASLAALTPSAHAAYEQVGCFAGSFPGPSESCKPVAEEKFGEEVQLAGVGGMAVNYTGAGGVPKGTLYEVTRASTDMRVAMYVPDGEGLRFAEEWVVTKEGGSYEVCGPPGELPNGEAVHPSCSPRVEASPGSVDVDVDQNTGNVYVLNVSTARPQSVVEYSADGGREITRFGEVAPVGQTVAESPAKTHESGYPGGLAVNDEGEVYVFDATSLVSFYHRLMVFRPKTPGDFTAYEYAGEVAAGAFGEGKLPTMPVTDAAGNVYVAGIEDTYIERYAPEEPKPFPAPHATPTCTFSFVKGGISALAVNQLTGEPFFYSVVKESKARWVRQLGPCEAGKFKEVGKAEVKPERAEIWALAFDPARRASPTRPQGIVYAGAPGAVPDSGKGEPGQSSLGYVFAQPKGATPTKTLTVAKTGSGQGTVTSEPEGISCGTTCAVEFEEGTKITLTAIPAEGSTFAGWSGACSGTGSCEVTMSEARSVTAEFSGEAGPILHALKVTVSGEGSVSADSGTISGCTSAGGPSCEGTYEEGAEVTLTETPQAGNLFAGWGTPQCDESTATTCVIAIGSGDEAVAASFEAEPEEPGLPLKVSVQGPGTVSSDTGLISCPPFCEDEYVEGTKVTLTASPSPGSLFGAWKHCDSGGVNGRSCTVTMSKAKEVQALFLTAHTLTLTKAEGSGPGKLSSYGGTVCLYACTEAAATIKEGTAIAVKATPAKHFHLSSWGGDCSGTGGCELAMGEDHEVSALFEADPKLSLSLAKEGGGQALIKTKPAGLLCGYLCPKASAAFYEGEAITLTYILSKGTTKLSWQEGAGTCTGSTEAPEGTCTLSLNEATQLEAKLE